MKSAFYDAFEAVINSNSKVYIPTGYDPLNDEFLITIKTLSYIPVEGSILDVNDIGDPIADPGEDIFGGAEEAIEGCADPSAGNFDNDATIEDGSCVYMGCMQPGAINYNPQATHECDNNSSDTFTTVEEPVTGDLYDAPNYEDCVCRYFQPCILDAFSIVPDGIFTFSDAVDLYDFIFAGAGAVPPETANQIYGPVEGSTILSGGAINSIGLDFVWVIEGGYPLPPIELNGGNEWVFEEDTFTQSAFNYLVAVYTEGPTGYTGQTNLNAPPATLTSNYVFDLVNIWDEASGSDVLDFEEGVGYTINGEPWHTQVDYSLYTGGVDCTYVGCTDPTALNYDSAASEACPGAPVFTLLSGDDDVGEGFEGECPEGFIGIPPNCECIETVPFYFTYCLGDNEAASFVDCEGLALTNINVSQFPSLANYLPTIVNPQGNEVFRVNNESELEALMTALGNQQTPDGCDYVIFATASEDCFGCGELPDTTPESDLYYYYQGCCIYICPSTQNSPYSDCNNQTYNGDDWDINNPNPDHDYNPNIDGIQQPENGDDNLTNSGNSGVL